MKRNGGQPQLILEPVGVEPRIQKSSTIARSSTELEQAHSNDLKSKRRRVQGVTLLVIEGRRKYVLFGDKRYYWNRLCHI